jgi:hypothetical protein
MDIPNAKPLTAEPEPPHVVGSNHGSIVLKNPDVAVISDMELKDEEEDDRASKSDAESEDEATPQKPQVSERRRNQNLKFASWFVVLSGMP